MTQQNAKIPAKWDATQKIYREILHYYSLYFTFFPLSLSLSLTSSLFSSHSAAVPQVLDTLSDSNSSTTANDLDLIFLKGIMESPVVSPPVLGSPLSTGQQKHPPLTHRNTGPYIHSLHHPQNHRTLHPQSASPTETQEKTCQESLDNFYLTTGLLFTSLT